jgi:hypothetical protein
MNPHDALAWGSLLLAWLGLLLLGGALRALWLGIARPPRGWLRRREQDDG